MKKHFPKLSAFAAALFISFSAIAGGPTANLQVIHNCADPLASSVDVYVNGSLFLDNFDFRTATPFTQVPAGVSIEVGVAPSNSTSVNDTLKTFTLGPLATDSNYIVVASGTVGTGFAANPNGRSIAFDLKVVANAKTTSGNAGLVAVDAFHGATDAPGVDVRVRGGGPLLVNNLKYGDASGYLNVPPAYYQLEVITEDSALTYNTWIANVSTLGGSAAFVFASGFLTPSANNSGPAFGLYAALPNGTVIALPVRQTANVQLVHNAADPALDSVDVYVNGQLGFPNLKFRGATPYIPITAGVPIQLGIAPGNSTSWADTVKTWTYFFDADSNYVAMAVGVNGSGFAANPNGVSTALDVVVKEGTIISNGNSGIVSFCVAHGATDAPKVDVRVRSGGPLLVNNAQYKDVTGYINVPPTYYALEVLTADSVTVYDAWIANLSSLGGSGAYVFASGFLSPSNNNGGADFGLFAALPTGQVVAFPKRQTATVQFVNNSTSQDKIDVYINGAKYFGNFTQRVSSPALGIMTANFPINIAIAPGGSTSINDTFWQKTLFFSPGEFYIGTASGNVGTGFAANPDGKSTAFDLLIKTPGQLASTNSNEFQFFAIHGSPDAPTVDVKVRGGATLIDNAAYGDQTSYIGVPSGSYVLDVTDASGTTVVKSYVADLSTLAGQSGTILASGYLDPTSNNNRPSFGLFLITPSGGPFVGLPEYVGINELNKEIGLNMFPNPSNGTLNINFNLPANQQVTIDITNLNGQVIKQVTNQVLSGQQNITVDLNNLSNGMYFARITTADKTSTNKFTLVK
jgi:hypothetical protein